jgi:hypothetical protein
VAFLTADPDYSGSLMPTADRRAFLETLTEIYSIPPDLANLRILIKSHPRGDISPLLQELSPHPPPNVTVINPLKSVIELLEKAWVVVLGNHYGGVVVQAVLSGKPLIFLNSARPFWPFTEKLGFAAGEVIEDVTNLWNLLRELQNSLPRYQELEARCRRFREDYLQPVTESLSQHIRSLDAIQDKRDGRLTNKPFYFCNDPRDRSDLGNILQDLS